MVIRAAKADLRIAEFPIEYHPRAGESKLSSFRDGWRHLRFLLVHSPTHLFILPGALLAGLGTLIVALVGERPRLLRALVGHPRADRRLAVDGGRHAGAGARACVPTPTAPTSWASSDPWSGVCAPVSASSTACCSAARSCWSASTLGAVIVHHLDPQTGLARSTDEHMAVVAATLLIVGIQIFFSSFLLSILGLRRG